MSGRVLVVGDVMTDVIVIPEGPIIKGSDRRARVRSHPGGSGANQAVWLGAMAADVVFAGRVGQADLGGHEAYFRARGVEPALAGDAEAPSGVLVTLVDPDGERSFLTDRGANLHLCAADLSSGLLDGVCMVMISGYSLFAPGPRAAVLDLLARARASGIAIAVDPASVGFLREIGPAQFLDWVAGADWLFANAEEAELLTGLSDPDAQLRALGQQFATVVLKRGGLGAVLGDRTGTQIEMAAPTVPVIDSTGAGDAFAAGFIAALLDGQDAKAAMAGGIAAGAQAVQQVGGQPARGPEPV